MLQTKEHSQKLTPDLFKNDVVLYFESYWKRENVADINFCDFPTQKERYFAADQVKGYGFKK